MDCAVHEHGLAGKPGLDELDDRVKFAGLKRHQPAKSTGASDWKWERVLPAGVTVAVKCCRLLPMLLPFKALATNDVTDVADFPTYLLFDVILFSFSC